MVPSPPRLLIFGDPSWFMSAILTEAVLRRAQAEGVEVVGVCDVGSRPRRHRRAITRAVLAAAVKRAFDADHPVHLRSLAFRDLRKIARGFGARILVPPDRNVNDPGFVRMVANELRPDWSLALGCGQVFGHDLLTALRYAVNYHNGLLPAYRGVGATAWSLFRDEPATGFTFHVMNERIDDGPILLQAAVPVSAHATVVGLEWEKTVEAVRRMEALFAMLRRRDPGRPQTGTPSFFGLAALRRIRMIDDPATHTWRDLVRRARSFDYLDLRLGAQRYEVTKLRAVPPARRPGPLAFRTSDGIAAEPVRFLHLPGTLYRLYRPFWLRKRRRRSPRVHRSG